VLTASLLRPGDLATCHTLLVPVSHMSTTDIDGCCCRQDRLRLTNCTLCCMALLPLPGGRGSLLLTEPHCAESWNDERIVKRDVPS
jgi:hypothetical protein